MKQKCNLLRHILGILVVTVLIAGFYACDDDDVSSPFTLRYMEIQNIGTGMSFEATPYYSGVTPTDFTIQKVKLNGEEIENTGFTINAETGVISITYQNRLAAGVYTLTIGCKAGGSLLSFPDVLTVRMLPAAPAVFKYKQPVITSEYGRFDTAYVAEISESVQIDKFIVEETGDGAYFKIDAATGTVYWKEFPIDQTPEPRHYRPAIGIVTPSGTQFYNNVLEFNITSAPMKLRYEVAEKESEKGYADTSAMPVYVGSPDQLVYTVKSAKYGEITTDKIHVTPEGRIYVDKNNDDMTQGEYLISLTLTNQYGSKDFDNVFTWRIVNYIAPIENFSYAETTCHRLKAFSISVADNFKGDGVTFSFANPLPEALKGLTINAATGKISAPKGHKMTIGDYTIDVKAVNSKAPNGVTTTLTLHVKEHPNFFTISYGNNLGLSHQEASQYSLPKLTENYEPILPKIFDNNRQEIASTGITYKKLDQFSSTTKSHKNTSGSNFDISLDPQTGTLTLNKVAGVGAGAMNYVLIEASKGEGDDEYTVKIPVFFQVGSTKAPMGPNGYGFSFIPFVLKVNPTKDYVSPHALQIRDFKDNGSPLKASLYDQSVYIDFSQGVEGQTNYSPLSTQERTNEYSASPMLSALWATYYGSRSPGKTNPISLLVESDKIAMKLCYIDENNKLHVNANLWKNPEEYGGKPANGIYWARACANTDGTALTQKSDNVFFPVVLWFDPEF